MFKIEILMDDNTSPILKELGEITLDTFSPLCKGVADYAEVSVIEMDSDVLLYREELDLSRKDCYKAFVAEINRSINCYNTLINSKWIVGAKTNLEDSCEELTCTLADVIKRVTSESIALDLTTQICNAPGKWYSLDSIHDLVDYFEELFNNYPQNGYAVMYHTMPASIHSVLPKDYGTLTGLCKVDKNRDEEPNEEGAAAVEADTMDALFNAKHQMDKIADAACVWELADGLPVKRIYVNRAMQYWLEKSNIGL